MAIKSVKRGRQTAPRCRNLPLKFNVIRDFSQDLDLLTIVGNNIFTERRCKNMKQEYRLENVKFIHTKGQYGYEEIIERWHSYLSVVSIIFRYT